MCIRDSPKVAESAVIGVPDALRGEVVAAYVVPSDDSLTTEELKAYCAQSLSLIHILTSSLTDRLEKQRKAALLGGLSVIPVLIPRS